MGRVFAVIEGEIPGLYVVREWNSNVWYFQRLAASADELEASPPMDDFVLRDDDANEWLARVDARPVDSATEFGLLRLNEISEW